jgi:ferritin-like metal-binding protein YciE
MNTYTVPAAFGERAKDEAELTRLLNQHLAETEAGMLNLETTRKLNKMLVRVQKDLQNEYVHGK